MDKNFSAAGSHSLTVRLKIEKSGGMLGRVTTLLGDHGADIEGLDIVGHEDGCTVRDITFYVDSPDTGESIVEALRRLDHVEVVNASDRTFRVHLGGKLHVVGKAPINTREDLGMVYTPGVARVCSAIHADRGKAYSLTIKGHTIAVVSDGSRVLALGNIGPEAAMPVMEGKAALFKRFGDVDAFPICLDTQDAEEIIRTVKAIAPAFGGINLEDIASPRCYEIEKRLRDELDIPVFHDDQHGTSIVVLAAAINAVRLVRKRMSRIKVVAVGVGAAGMACIKLLMAAGVKNIIGFNSKGAVHADRDDLTDQERWLAEHTNQKKFGGTIQEALKGADMFLGLSVGGIIQASDLSVMKRDPIVFALANPVPEVRPEEASEYARVIATGGSNYPNQINNALVFPGIFRGALDCRVSNITEEMKVEAARALAAIVRPKERDDDYIIPSIFHPKVHAAVADAVRKVAYRTGAARRPERT